MWKRPLIAVAGILPVLVAVPTRADDPVEAALAAVAATRAEHYLPATRLIGDLASPAELVAVEPDLRTLSGGKGPVAMVFDEATIEECRRRVKMCKELPRKPRVRAGIISLGISGIRVEDIKHAPAFPVVGVEAGGAAEGLLEVGDVIVGANGRLFPANDDPRMHVGYALAAAQTDDLEGVLTLQVVRDGAAVNVIVPLGVSGDYVTGWPYGSPKCRKILEQAQEFLVERAPDQVGGVGFLTQTYGNVLLLLATDEDQGWDLSRRLLYKTLPPHKVAKLYGSGCATWRRAYELIAQAEYYLLTGDSAILPGIENRAQVIAAGQAACGTWGHGLPCRGYGELNQAGAACFLGLALARECGVSFDREALAKAIRFFAKYAGGTVPYGNHTIEFRGSNNGCAALVAITYDVLGERDLAERFARYVAYTYRFRELGHAENIFSHSWGPIAARLAPEAEFRMFMDNTLWMFELERTPWGGLWQLGKRACGSLTATTGPIGLFLGLPEPRLRVLGAPRSVFGTEPPTERSREAADCYRRKDWIAFKTAAAACLAEGATAGERHYAEQLLAAYERMENHAAAVISLAETNIGHQRLHMARQQIEGLEMMLGGERPATAALKKRLATDAAAAVLAGPAPPAPDLPTRVEEKLPPDDQQAKAGGQPHGPGGESPPPAAFSAAPDEVVYAALREKSPAEIARHFSHPYFYGMVGASRAMAHRGQDAVPLLKQLLASEHPAVRRGAVMSVGRLCAAPGGTGPKERATESVGSETDRGLRLIKDAAGDSDEFVQLAVAAAITDQADSAETRPMLVAFAGSRWPSVRNSALALARRNCNDPQTKVRVAIQIDTTAPAENTVRHWEQAHFVLEQARDHAQPALPALAGYFAGWAYRIQGMFSDAATVRAMNVIDAHRSHDAVLVVVPGLCRTYVRITDSDYHGWVKCRQMVFATLEELAPRARTQLAAAIRAERQTLAALSDEELKAAVPHGTKRAILDARITELETLLEPKQDVPAGR